MVPSSHDLWARFEDALRAQAEGSVGSELQATMQGPMREAPAVTFWGDEMTVILPELVGCELATYGLIEPGLTRLFLDLVTRRSVVFDVGAHLGYFSLLASTLGAEVHAFEPSAETLTLLRRNVAGRALVVPKGLWRSPGTLELKDFGPGHSALNTFHASKDEGLTEPARTTEVEVASIDDYVATTGVKPDLIKVDVEGAEREVLIGSRTTIEKRRPIITLEVGDAEGTPRTRPALDLAAGLGYDLYDMTPNGVAPHELRDTYGYGNVLLLPAGRTPPTRVE